MAAIGGWGLDVSNHSGKFSVATAQRMAAEGWTRGIVSTYDRDIARAQLQAFKGADMEIQAYVYLRAELDPAVQVTAAINKVLDLGITKLWLDCEGAPTDPIPNHWETFPSPAFIVDFIHRAADACTDKVYSGIYTSRAWWMKWTSDSVAFKEYPNWTATNDGLGDLSFNPYGGWTECEMEQFGFDLKVAGVNTDWNAIALAPPPPAPPPPDPTPTPPAPDEVYMRGWKDHDTATRAALDSIREPWQ